MSILIIIEFVLPFAAIAAFLFWVVLRQKSKHADALKALLAAVKDQDAVYESNLKAFLAKRSGGSEEGVDADAEPFIQGRRKYYKQLLEAWVSLDPRMMPVTETTLQNFLNLYHNLPVAQTEDEADEGKEKVPSDELDVVKTQNQVLKKENKRLKAEIHVSMSALNSLFKEFSSMFGEIAPDSGNMTVNEILEAMEKLTKGSFKPESVVGDIPPELDMSENETNTTAEADTGREEAEKSDGDETNQDASAAGGEAGNLNGSTEQRSETDAAADELNSDGPQEVASEDDGSQPQEESVSASNVDRSADVDVSDERSAESEVVNQRDASQEAEKAAGSDHETTDVDGDRSGESEDASKDKQEEAASARNKNKGDTSEHS